MEFRELKTFQVTASLLSFYKAAKVLNYAQSTVSSQIQSLENSLGEALFIRSGSKISLTPAGVKMLDYSQRLINIEKEIISNFKGLKDKHGNLTIKTPQSVSAYFFPTLIQEFQMLFPKIGFDIDWCTSYHLNDIFNAGIIDLAFLITDNFNEKFLQIEKLADVNLVLAAHPQDDLVQKPKVSVADLNDKTLIFAKSDCNYKNILQKMIIQSDIQLKKIIEINSLDAVKQLLLLGNGIAFIPEVVIKNELDTGLLKTLNWKGPDFNARLFMIWNNNKHQNDPVKAFMHMARKFSSIGI